MSWHSGLQLCVVEGPGLGQGVPLTTPQLTIGRARPDDTEAPGWVFLRDPAVSRQHAHLRWDHAAGHFVLIHRSGTNLTWINGQVVEESAPIRVGDRIKVGTVVLEVQEAPAPEAATPVAAAPAPRAEPPPPPPKPVPLKAGPGFWLEVLDGPDQGLEVELTGPSVTVGHGSSASGFDQVVELTDPQAAPNHVALSWREREKAYGLFKRPEAPDVRVYRDLDGFHFEARLEEGVFRAGDSLTLGGTRLRLVHRESRGIRL
ncbi:MAG: FHA domain-containing protein [Candidatus Eremiobacterota bacterium]